MHFPYTGRSNKDTLPFLYSRLQRGICFCTALSLWLLFQDLTLVRLYSNTQKLFTWIIPRLTHFPRFSFNGGQHKRLCITEMIEETRILKKYTAVQSVMVSESMVLFDCEKGSQWKISLPSLPLQSHLWIESALAESDVEMLRRQRENSRLVSLG